MIYVVSDRGPLDRLPPGTPVTDRYNDKVMELLLEAGLVEEYDDSPKKSSARKPKSKAEEVSDADKGN